MTTINITDNLYYMGNTPEGTEGVIKYKRRYLWYKFSTTEYYEDTLQTWITDVTPEDNEVLVDLREKNDTKSVDSKLDKNQEAENSGLSCNYYVAEVTQPTTTGVRYTAECNDIIETLGMSPTEANIFKELWRTSAARTLGKKKKGSNTKRAAEKVAFFGLRYALQNGVTLEELITTLQQMRVQATITQSRR